MANDLLDEFLFDTKEQLVTAGEQLLELEKQPSSLESLNALMGTLHTIKGNSGFLAIESLYNLLHGGETLLQTVRENPNIAANETVIEYLFKMLDTTEEILERLKNGVTDQNDLINMLKPFFESALKTLEPSNESHINEEQLDILEQDDSQTAVYNDLELEYDSEKHLIKVQDEQISDIGFIPKSRKLADLVKKPLILDLSELNKLTNKDIEMILLLQSTLDAGLNLLILKEMEEIYKKIFSILSLENKFNVVFEW